MGRHSSHEYQVKNTFVDIQIPEEEQQYGRSQRTVSDTAAGEFEQAPIDSGMKARLEEYRLARTPSPFMHPAQDPTAPMLDMQLLPGCGYDLAGGSMPIAFGDFDIPDFDLVGFEGIDAQACNVYDPSNGMNMYDPSSGMYMPYDWSMQSGYEGYDGYSMMTGMPMEGGMDEFGNCIAMMPDGSVGHTEQLMAQLSEKLGHNELAEHSFPSCSEGMVVPMDAYGEAVVPTDAMDSQPMLNMGCGETGGRIEDWSNAQADWNSTETGWNNVDGDWNSGGQFQTSPNGKNRNARVRQAGGRDGGAQELSGPQNTSSSACAQAANQQGDVDFTTVMFRNIPNKYTREMLVKQLEVELKGNFDFVYLPIDFKNQCNVGYAFINFRNVEACKIFLQNFNGVEVRKCLPGLNSRKVTEVTPARVQGFEDNVQRLRNSPVMRELAHHPEWMPLIFDENGVQVLFPQPERTLEPIKPRRRAREEVAAGAGA